MRLPPDLMLGLPCNVFVYLFTDFVHAMCVFWLPTLVHQFQQSHDRSVYAKTMMRSIQNAYSSAYDSVRHCTCILKLLTQCIHALVLL